MSKQEIVKDWTTDAGLRAVVLMTSMGHHCGYVGVPAGHPLHGLDYDTPMPLLMAPDAEEIQSPECFFSVHGGITYAGGSEDYPAPSDGLWWFGYDCAHLHDCVSPAFIASHPEERRWLYAGHSDQVFRDLDYCTAECESLASQIVTKVVTA